MGANDASWYQFIFILDTGSLMTSLQVYLTSPTIYRLIITGLNVKWLFKDVPGVHAKYIRNSYTRISCKEWLSLYFQVSNGRQRHPKSIQYRQCSKACVRPDHHLNMEMIINDIIIIKNISTGYLLNWMIVDLFIANMSCMCQNWSWTGPILAGNIGTALA